MYCTDLFQELNLVELKKKSNFIQIQIELRDQIFIYGYCVLTIPFIKFITVIINIFQLRLFDTRSRINNN